MGDWKHKDEWKKMGPDMSERPFSVLVSRHEGLVEPEFGSGPHRWCVYAYIYPGHPLFADFDTKGEMFQDACSGLPLHWGPSFFRPHFGADGEEVSAFQVGSDYNHLHDEAFTMCATRDDAKLVFDDAELLYRHLAGEDPTP